MLFLTLRFSFFCILTLATRGGKMLTFVLKTDDEKSQLFRFYSRLICYLFFCISELRRLTRGSLAQHVWLWTLALLQTKCFDKCSF